VSFYLVAFADSLTVLPVQPWILSKTLGAFLFLQGEKADEGDGADHRFFFGGTPQMNTRSKND